MLKKKNILPPSPSSKTPKTTKLITKLPYIPPQINTINSNKQKKETKIKTIGLVKNGGIATSNHVENIKSIPRANINGGIVNHLGEHIYKIQHPVRLILTGRSTMGKTTLGVDIILKNIISQVGQVFVACPTFWQQSQFAPLRNITNCFNTRNVFTHVTDEVFEKIFKILDHQKGSIKTLLIVDDAAAEGATNKGNKGAFSRLCLASIHLNLTIIGMFQRLTSASPAFRDNAECLVSFTPSKRQDITTIIEEFNPNPAITDNDDNVRRVLNDAWESHRFVFIHRPAFYGNIDYYAGFDKQLSFSPKHT